MSVVEAPFRFLEVNKDLFDAGIALSAHLATDSAGNFSFGSVRREQKFDPWAFQPPAYWPSSEAQSPSKNSTHHV